MSCPDEFWIIDQVSLSQVIWYSNNEFCLGKCKGGKRRRIILILKDQLPAQGQVSRESSMMLEIFVFLFQLNTRVLLRLDLPLWMFHYVIKLLITSSHLNVFAGGGRATS